MYKFDFDHTNARFFLSFWFYYFFFFCLSQFSDDFPIIPPDENSWIRTGTVNEYMRI